jgi:hypothetical protein
MIGYIVAFGLGVVFSIAGFAWLNRNKPEAVDKVEGQVRDFKK